MTCPACDRLRLRVSELTAAVELLVSALALAGVPHDDAAVVLARAAAERARKDAANGAEADECEHGVRDGDWCPDCREEYRRARRENGDE